jgi:hypothetical protein
VLDEACHWPPFFSQSALVLYWAMSADEPGPVDGLAEGDGDDAPLDEVPEPLDPLPDPLLSDVPDVPLGLLLPGACAAAMAGARPMTTTRSANRILFISSSSKR